MLGSPACPEGLLQVLYNGVDFVGPVEPMMQAFGYYSLLIYKGINLAAAYDTLANKD
jgi:hypothetical protein